MPAVLEAAESCALECPRPGCPTSWHVLAWVVREGTEHNVLRHSSATRAGIEVALRDGSAVLDHANDGVGTGGPRSRTGLGGLSERVAPWAACVGAGPR